MTLGVGYNWRFQPALQEIRRMLDDGRLGRLLHIEGNFCGPSVYRFKKEHWRQQREEGPAGGMTGRGVHVVDAMLYLAGQVDTVHAQSYRLALDYGIDDTTSMLFRFKSGATGYLEVLDSAARASGFAERRERTAAERAARAPGARSARGIGLAMAWHGAGFTGSGDTEKSSSIGDPSAVGRTSAAAQPGWSWSFALSARWPRSASSRAPRAR